MAAERLWAVFNAHSGKVIEGFSDAELRAYLMAFTPTQLNEIYLFTQQTPKWTSARDIINLFPPLARRLGYSLPPLPQPAEVEDIKDLIVTHKMSEDEGQKKVIPLHTIPDVEIEKNGEFIPRAFKRFQRRLRVELECQGRKFITHSVDVSVGGVRVEKPIPEWIFGYCTCDLVNEKTNEVAELTCSVVENQDPQSRFRLEFTNLVSRDQQSQLEAWLQAA